MWKNNKKVCLTFRWLLAGVVLDLLSDMGAEAFFLSGMCLLKVSSTEFFLALS